jgi:hypothetical protein
MIDLIDKVIVEPSTSDTNLADVLDFFIPSGEPTAIVIVSPPLATVGKD